jgi:WD40 repeat protein
MRLGNLYRLVGDEEGARKCFQEAHSLYASRVYRDRPFSLDVEHMIPCSFLLGHDEEVAELSRLLRSTTRAWDLQAYTIAELAQARRCRDADAVTTVIEKLADYIRRAREKVSNTGGVLPWDWYGIALELQRELEPEKAGQRATLALSSKAPTPTVDLHPVCTLAANAASVAWSPDGAWLAAHDGPNVLVWRSQDGKPRRFLEGHGDPVSSLSWSPDGRWLASASRDQTIRIWRVRDGEPQQVLQEPKGDAIQVLFGPSSQTLASLAWHRFEGPRERALRQWRVHDGRQLWAAEPEDYGALAWSPDGELLATWLPRIQIWQAQDGWPVRTLLGDACDYVTSLAWSPGGQLLASGADTGEVRLWRVRDGHPLQRLRRHVEEDKLRAITMTAFSPSGQILASAGEDGNIFLWSVPDGVCLHSLLEHEGPIESLAWDPAGQALASGGQDGMLRLWDVRGGRQLLQLEAHSGGVRHVAWSPTGHMLASLGMRDGTVQLWRVERHRRTVRGTPQK